MTTTILILAANPPKTDRLKLDYELRIIKDNDLISLEKNRERLIECQQNKYGETERYESWLEELLHLDQLTENWLEQEIEEQIAKARETLHLIELNYFGERGALITDPIRSLIGCK